MTILDIANIIRKIYAMYSKIGFDFLKEHIIIPNIGDIKNVATSIFSIHFVFLTLENFVTRQAIPAIKKISKKITVEIRKPDKYEVNVPINDMIIMNIQVHLISIFPLSFSYLNILKLFLKNYVYYRFKMLKVKF